MFLVLCVCLHFYYMRFRCMFVVVVFVHLIIVGVWREKIGKSLKIACVGVWINGGLIRTAFYTIICPFRMQFPFLVRIHSNISYTTVVVIIIVAITSICFQKKSPLIVTLFTSIHSIWRNTFQHRRIGKIAE